MALNYHFIADARRISGQDLLYPRRQLANSNAIKINPRNPITRDIYDVYFFGRKRLASLINKARYTLAGAGIEVFGNSIRTSALGEYIDLGTLPVSDWSAASFYLRYGDVTGGGSGGRIFSVQHSGGDDIRAYYASPSSDKTSVSTAWDDGTPTTITDTVANVHDNHLIITHDGSTQKVYLNGQLVSSDTDSYTFSTCSGGTRVGQNSATSWIGANYKSLHIWTRVLDDAEVFRMFSKLNDLYLPIVS